MRLILNNDILEELINKGQTINVSYTSGSWDIVTNALDESIKATVKESAKTGGVSIYKIIKGTYCFL